MQIMHVDSKEPDESGQNANVSICDSDTGIRSSDLALARASRLEASTGPKHENTQRKPRKRVGTWQTSVIAAKGGRSGGSAAYPRRSRKRYA